MHNYITDITQIKEFDMPKLSSLNVAGNHIKDLSPLINMDYSKIPHVKIVLGNCF